jgi:hypothetical protein
MPRWPSSHEASMGSPQDPDERCSCGHRADAHHKEGSKWPCWQLDYDDVFCACPDFLAKVEDE